MPEIHVLERIVHAPSLGLRCVDAATGSPVTEGLWITASPLSGAPKVISASRSLSGAYVFHRLPGLLDFEFGDREFPGPTEASPPEGREFAVIVEDLTGRYLPWGTLMTLPRSGIFETFLYPAPSLEDGKGMAVVRGSLKDPTLTTLDGGFGVAGYARVEAILSPSSPPAPHMTWADSRGQFTLLFPFPNPLQPPPGTVPTSPNTAGRRALSELRWPVELSFFYAPGEQRFIALDPDGRVHLIDGQRPGLTDRPPPGWRCVPRLSSLFAQGVSEVIPSVGSPAVTEPNYTVEIEFGKAAVVRARDGEADLLLVPS